jgi:hypothetical protein
MHNLITTFSIPDPQVKPPKRALLFTASRGPFRGCLFLRTGPGKLVVIHSENQKRVGLGLGRELSCRKGWLEDNSWYAKWLEPVHTATLHLMTDFTPKVRKPKAVKPQPRPASPSRKLTPEEEWDLVPGLKRTHLEPRALKVFKARRRKRS